MKPAKVRRQKRCWTIRESEAATGLKSASLTEHIKAGTVLLDEDERDDVGARGRGTVRRLSEATVLDIAGAVQLQRLGLPFAAGITAMLRFTDIGGYDCQRCGAPRVLAKPFPTGETYLIAGPGVSGGVVHGCPGSEGQNIEWLLLDADRVVHDAFCEGREAVTIVNVGRIYENVRTALGLDPHDFRPKLNSGEAR